LDARSNLHLELQLHALRCCLIHGSCLWSLPVQGNDFNFWTSVSARSTQWSVK
jgi:hypothetical protein